MKFDYSEKLYKLFLRGVYDGADYAAVWARERTFGVKSRELRSALTELKVQGKIELKCGRYFVNPRLKAEFEKQEAEKLVKLVGVIRTNERGFGFLTVEGDKDYFISPENLGDALNGDTVEAYPVSGRGTNDSARVLKVLSRGKTALVGVFFREGAYSYVRPDDKGYLSDIFIPDKCVGEAKVGDKVYLSITDFPKRRCPEGKIESVIGRQFTLDTEEKAIILNYGLDKDFTPEASSEAAAIKQEIADNEVIGRLNLENELIFTIDGDTAKDFDDAVSLGRTEDGNYRLGVHIADVSAYVTMDSPLDKCAFERSTSVYFPDRVIPMLPFELSNGIYSLNEGVRRFTLSVFCEIDDGGKILKTDFYKSVIRSKKRLTYRKVDALFDGDETVKDEYKEVAESLFEMRELAQILKKRRSEQGYIDLDVKESDITIDGDKITVQTHKATEATQLIEQFMITANEAVASFLFYQKLPCVYRIHEKPLKEKLEFLREFTAALGIKFILRRDECYPKDFQKLLSMVGDKDCAAVVNKTVLRSLQKAKYSTENLGHFGLASKCYCHFTSPIRRYPDLLVHRALKAALDGSIMELIDLYEDFFQKAAYNSSQKERNAEDAERAVDDLYKAKYLEDHVGEEFRGVISGVKDSGVFVEFENGCEVFCPIETFPAGAYDYDRDSFTLESRRYGFTIGKPVGVAILGVDLSERKAQAVLTDIKACKKRK